MKLTNEQITAVKARGFLQNRGTELFSGRIVSKNGTVFSSEDFKNLSLIASQYGNGTLAATSRLSIEISGIPYDKIEEAELFALEHNLSFGGTGAKVRPIAACKGTTCIYGNFDTQGLAKRLYSEFYEGYSSVALPHKFKIAVGGCPNSCMKPSLNDFGIQGHKAPIYNSELCRGCKVCQIEKRCPMKACSVEGGKLVIDKEKCILCGVCTGKCPFGAVENESRVLYRIFVGGTWGKHTRMGTSLSRLVSEEEIIPILEKTILWYKENALPKERLGRTIDRVGFDSMEKALFSDELLTRKAEILAK